MLVGINSVLLSEVDLGLYNKDLIREFKLDRGYYKYYYKDKVAYLKR